MTRALLSAAALVLSAGAIPAGAADRLVVGTTTAQIVAGDPLTGGFEFFGVCGGPVRSMTQHGPTLFIADQSGVVYVLDTQTNATTSAYFLGSGLAGISADGGWLYAAYENGTVKRLIPTTGQVVATFSGPAAINAILASEGYIFVGGPDGAVYRASAADDNFSYFTCFCNLGITAIARDGNTVLVGDNRGVIFRFSADTADSLLGAAFINSPITGLVPFGDAVIASNADGQLFHVDLISNTIDLTLEAPAGISAMLMLDDGVCPADFDGNGALNGQDFDLYTAAFELGAAESDFNADGFVSGDDFDAFVLAFEQGC